MKLRYLNKAEEEKVNMWSKGKGGYVYMREKRGRLNIDSQGRRPCEDSDRDWSYTATS